jgi:hypothetical protein
MKRTIKPNKGETLGEYWRRCEGRFINRWDVRSLNYAIKNGGIVKSMIIVDVKQ